MLCSFPAGQNLLVAYSVGNNNETVVTRVPSKVELQKIPHPGTPHACAFTSANHLYILAENGGNRTLYSCQPSSDTEPWTTTPLANIQTTDTDTVSLTHIELTNENDCIVVITAGSNSPFQVFCLSQEGNHTPHLSYTQPVTFVTSHQSGTVLGLWNNDNATLISFDNIPLNNLSNANLTTYPLPYGSTLENIIAMRPFEKFTEALGFNGTGIYYISLQATVESTNDHSTIQVTGPVNSTSTSEGNSPITTYTPGQPVWGTDSIYYVSPNGEVSQGPNLQDITGQQNSANGRVGQPTDGTGSPGNPSDHGNGAGTGANAPSSTPVAAIIGGVVGGVLVMAIVVALLVWRYKKRRLRERGEKLTSYMDDVNDLSETVVIPALLTTDAVTEEHLTPEETQRLLPDAPGRVTVFKNNYLLHESEAEILPKGDYRISGYATRDITVNGKPGTLHYFPVHAREAFLRSVNVARLLLQHDERRRLTIAHYNAMRLTHPTPGDHPYLYFWVTSFCETSQTLHNVRTGKSDKVVLDTGDFAFNAWSAHSMLDALRLVHENNIVHLGLTPHCFYINTETFSDWELGGFDQAHDMAETSATVALNTYSAPELFAASSDNYRTSRGLRPEFASDIFSLGCVIYFLVVGRPLFESAEEVGKMVNDDKHLYANLLTKALQDADKAQASFRDLLEKMLILEPSQRWTAKDLVTYWRETAGLYDDVEEGTVSEI